MANADTDTIIELLTQLWVSLGQVSARLGRIEAKVTNVIKSEEKMSEQMDALHAEVERNTQVDQSAIALLNGLSAKIEELKNDPVALQSFADELKGSSDALAAAVVANTPAAPPAEPPPGS